MHIHFKDQILKYPCRIASLGMLLALCLSLNGPQAAQAQAAANVASMNILTVSDTPESKTIIKHIFPIIINGNVGVVDVINGIQKQLTYSGMDYSPILSPDGLRIAYITGSPEFQPKGNDSPNINIIDVDGRNPISISTGEGLVSLPAWSPDSNQLA